ncbi:hypothetical protein PPERSA_12997 [Pseudocohnilembus persalinus]|uniref:Uncharacterized protein n=1 Tax=Pseudocohnilembus persalinus TaxID=266149 RepID=A0A0V0R1V8_PSEPJ|nr:hypothetical protein PPERSA_12997 [Pseudocohnilembus persalinus]|eukprot:KRX08516.1 hypothetical protein PPERSA_12997 [Pseudocohnilembus persalinus]
MFQKDYKPVIGISQQPQPFEVYQNVSQNFQNRGSFMEHKSRVENFDKENQKPFQVPEYNSSPSKYFNKNYYDNLPSSSIKNKNLSMSQLKLNNFAYTSTGHNHSAQFHQQQNSNQKPLNVPQLRQNSQQNFHEFNFNSVKNKDNLNQVIKKEVQKEIEIFKNEIKSSYEKLLSYSKEINQETNSKIGVITDQVQSHQSSIQSLNQEIQNIFSKAEQTIQNYQQLAQFKSEENEMSEIVQQKLKNQLELKIDTIRFQQQELKKQVEQIKNDMTNEIQCTLQMAQQEINDQNQEEDEKIYKYMEQIQKKFDSKINVVFDNLLNKVQNLESNVSNFKKELSQNEMNQIQNDIYKKFDDCVKKFDLELLDTKAKIDGKLDQKDLQEVIQGYTEYANNSSSMEHLKGEIQHLQSKLEQNENEYENKENNFYQKVQQFEEYVQQSLSNLEERVNNFEMSENQQDTKKEENLKNKVQNLEAQINEINLQSQKITTIIQDYQQKMGQSENKTDNQETEIKQNFQQIDKNINYLKQKVEKDSKNYQQVFNQKVQNLELNVSSMNSQILEISDDLQNQFKQFQDQLENNQKNHKEQLETIRKTVIEYGQQDPQNYILNKKFYLQEKNDQIHQETIQGQNSQNTKQNVVSPLQNMEGNKQLQIQSQFEDCLKQYEDFNKEVTNYLSNKNVHKRQGSINFSKDKDNNDTNNNQYQTGNKQYLVENTNQNNCGSNNNKSHQFSATPNKMQKITKTLNLSHISTGKKSNQKSVLEDEEVVYQLDDNGYLLNENGDHICDDQGNWILLTQEHIEYLRGENMLDEQELSTISQNQNNYNVNNN